MTRDLITTVRENLINLGVGKEDRILLAFSGGVDSRALLDLLGILEGSSFRGLTAAHLDHSVRGRSSIDDALEVRTLCQVKGVPLMEHRLEQDEIERERRRRGSLEGALRVLRYSFLAEAADRAGAEWIATAHHQDDQVETVLFRIRRGMDWRSLSGIPKRENRVIRPMLNVRREQIEDYCLKAGFSYLKDETNLDMRFTRNRIRHLYLPALEENYHSDIHSLLLRLANAAGSLASGEEVMLQRLVPGMVPLYGEHEWDRETILEIPGPLREGMLLRILQGIIASHPKRRLVRDLKAIVEEGRVGRIRLPGGKELLVTRKSLQAGTSGRILSPPVTEKTWNIPGQIEVPELRTSLTAGITDYNGSSGFPRGNSCLISKKAVRAPLIVRTRRPGDRFRPLGMAGARSLKKFLIDRKVPREDRSLLLLVIDATGEIIWIPGLEVSERVRLRRGFPEEAYLLELEIGD